MREKAITAIVELLKRYRGVDFSGYREAIFIRCVEKRMAAMEIETPEGYLDLLKHNPLEKDRFLNLALVKVSSFYRNPLVFEVLLARILPDLLNMKRSQGNRELRIWSAGCATGEEPYSVALLILECLMEETKIWHINLFATDVNQESLRIAREGLYDETAIENVRWHLLRTHFKKTTDGYRLNESIKSLVHFSRDDLLNEQRIAPAKSIYGEFDLILCRNVMIYYELSLQKRILRKLTRALSPFGFLILGESESPPPEMKNILSPWDDSCRIYQKQEL